MRLNNKNKILVLTFLLFLVASYQYAISNTVAFYNEYKAANAKMASQDLSSEQLFSLKIKEKQLDSLMVVYDINPSDFFQNKLLGKLNTYCNAFGLRISNFQEPHISVIDNQQITSYLFTIEGSFNGSLMLINKLENSAIFGGVYHLSFVKKRNYKTNSDKIFTEIVLQVTKSI